MCEYLITASTWMMRNQIYVIFLFYSGWSTGKVTGQLGVPASGMGGIPKRAPVPVVTPTKQTSEFFSLRIKRPKRQTDNSPQFRLYG
jgi:hypothetical protein